LPDLENRSIFEQGFHERERLAKRRLDQTSVLTEIESVCPRAMADGHVAGFARLHSQRETYEIAGHAIQRRSLDIQGETSRFPRGRNPFRKPIQAGDRLVLRAVEWEF